MILLPSLIHGILSLLLLPRTKHSELIPCGCFVVVHLVLTTFTSHSLNSPFVLANSTVPYCFFKNHSYHCSSSFLQSERNLTGLFLIYSILLMLQLATENLTHHHQPVFFDFCVVLRTKHAFFPTYSMKKSIIPRTRESCFFFFYLRCNCVVLLALICSPSHHDLQHLQNINTFSITLCFTETQHHSL